MRATSERTRGRILDAALEQFNERGTAAVSTNHVAATAGISPGNLYYHFTDKQQIVRALFARYAEAFEHRWTPSGDAGANLAALRANLAAGAEQAWAFRFFERETRALLRTDPQLRADYQAVYRRRLDQWVAFAEQLVAQGMMRAPRPPHELRDLALAIWLVVEGWAGFVDVTGDPQDPAQIAKGTDLVTATLDAYLTDEGHRRFTGATP